jgi:hypothetical protein
MTKSTIGGGCLVPPKLKTDPIEGSKALDRPAICELNCWSKHISQRQAS